jgi:hypothetical protein
MNVIEKKKMQNTHNVQDNDEVILVYVQYACKSLFEKKINKNENETTEV